jgi:hypothetical protein
MWVTSLLIQTIVFFFHKLSSATSHNVFQMPSEFRRCKKRNEAFAEGVCRALGNKINKEEKRTKNYDNNKQKNKTKKQSVSYEWSLHVEAQEVSDLFVKKLLTWPPCHGTRMISYLNREDHKSLKS